MPRMSHQVDICAAILQHSRSLTTTPQVLGDETAVLEPSSQYKQYRSYAYLDAGVDYPDIPLAQQVGRVPAYTGLDLSPEQVTRTESLLRDNLVISLHDHPSVFPENLQRDMREYIRTGPRGDGLRRARPVRDDRRLRQRHGRHVLHQQRRRLEVGGRPPRPRDAHVRPGPPGLPRQGRVASGHPGCARAGPDGHRLRPRGRDDDRERGRPTGHPLRVRRPPDRHRLLGGQLPRQRSQGARRRWPHLLRRACRRPDEQAGAGHRHLPLGRRHLDGRHQGVRASRSS